MFDVERNGQISYGVWLHGDKLRADIFKRFALAGIENFKIIFRTSESVLSGRPNALSEVPNNDPRLKPLVLLGPVTHQGYNKTSY